MIRESNGKVDSFDFCLRVVIKRRNSLYGSLAQPMMLGKH